MVRRLLGDKRSWEVALVAVQYKAYRVQCIKEKRFLFPYYETLEFSTPDDGSKSYRLDVRLTHYTGVINSSVSSAYTVSVKKSTKFF